MGQEVFSAPIQTEKQNHCAVQDSRALSGLGLSFVKIKLNVLLLHLEDFMSRSGGLRTRLLLHLGGTIPREIASIREAKL